MGWSGLGLGQINGLSDGLSAQGPFDDFTGDAHAAACQIINARNEKRLQRQSEKKLQS
jgi:hypothetical protein